MSYTKEPWVIGEYGQISAGTSTNFGNRINLGGVTSPCTSGPAMDEADANARRIVACVNACAGMADPAAEIASLRSQLAACKSDCATLAAVIPEIVRESLT